MSNDFDPVDPVEPDPSSLDLSNPRDAAAHQLLFEAHHFQVMQDDDRTKDDRYWEDQARWQVDALIKAGWSPPNSDAIEVLQYVSRGRRYVDVEPYPDAQARRALGAMTEAKDE